MVYTVKLTEYATAQMGSIIAYIAQTLMAPESAVAWTDRLHCAMAGLSSMPHRYPLLDREPWLSEQVRKMPVENFLVYYWINEDDSIVWIIAVIYARRDQLEALRDVPSV